jgi:hypothetical protein
MEQLDSRWTHYLGILHLVTFLKSVDKFQVALKSDKYSGYYALRPIGIWITSRSILLTMEMFQTKIVEKLI